MCKQDVVYHNITAKNIRVVYASSSSEKRLKLILQDVLINARLVFVVKGISRDGI
jgi:hypothetical protein